MFKEERNESLFDWCMIGDVAKGRPNLGPNADVAVYRLMQFTLRDTLIKEFGVQSADAIFYAAGELAGRKLCENSLDTTKEFNAFIKDVQDLLLTLKVGILRVEEADMDALRFVVTVAEDLDCSGLPIYDETICTYDEGFISGLFTEYTGIKFVSKEIDCWCSGDRVCRFIVQPLGKTDNAAC